MRVPRLAALVAAANLILLALCANASAADCPGASDQPATATASDAATALVCEINATRAAHGLPALVTDGRLGAAAQGLATDMATRHYFAHVTPDGVDLTGRVRPTGYIPSNGTWSLSENIAWGTNTFATPLATLQSWMGSAGHRANLLDPGMRNVGIGIAQGAFSADAPSGVFYVADFGIRITSTATAAKHHRAHRRHRVRHHRR